MTCRSFGKSRSIKIEIDKPVLRKNGSIKYNYGSLAHSITIPDRVWYCDKDKQVYH
jgi:hypothetical protein